MRVTCICSKEPLGIHIFTGRTHSHVPAPLGLAQSRLWGEGDLDRKGGCMNQGRKVSGKAREVESSATLALILRFNDLFNRQELAGVMALMSEDCLFENTYPPPDGTRYVGQAQTREAFANFFAASPQARFETEEIFVAGDRCVVRWIYTWNDGENGSKGHVRGVDLFRVRDGKIAEKLSYVKG